MTKGAPVKVFFFEAHPLMILGIDSLIKKEEDLELCGYSSNHETLIEDITAAQPDAILLDLSLYAEESLKLIEEVRQQFPDPKIVLLSVHTAAEYVEKARKAGVDGYVLKIEDPERILDAVRTTISGETYISNEISQPGERKPQPIDSPINLLSTQEFQILQRIGKGETSRHISDELQLPVKTVDDEIATIQEKLHLSGFVELLQFAFHWVHHEGGFS